MIKDEFLQLSGKRVFSQGEKLTAAIRKEVHDILAADFEPLGQMRTAFVYSAGGKVFKAPKVDEDAAAVAREAYILNRLYAEGMRVPKVLDVGQESSFFSMEQLPDPAMTYKSVNRLTPQQTAIVVHDVARTKYAFEKMADEINLPKDQTLPKASPADIYGAFEDFLLRKDGSEVSRELLAGMKDYLTAMAERNLVPVQGDLQPCNILFDMKQGKSAFLLDFMDAQMSLPESEFYSMRKRGAEYPESFVTALVAEYASVRGVTPAEQEKDIIFFGLARAVDRSMAKDKKIEPDGLSETYLSQEILKAVAALSLLDQKQASQTHRAVPVPTV